MLEILKTQYNQGKDKDIYYFRDSKGFEIDAIVPTSQGSFIPFEFKSAMTFSSDFTANLRKMCKFAPQAINPTVVYSGKMEGVSNSVNFINFKNLSSRLTQYNK